MQIPDGGGIRHNIRVVLEKRWHWINWRISKQRAHAGIKSPSNVARVESPSHAHTLLPLVQEHSELLTSKLTYVTCSPCTFPYLHTRVFHQCIGNVGCALVTNARPCEVQLLAVVGMYIRCYRRHSQRGLEGVGVQRCWPASEQAERVQMV